jgi:hypothetical protein
MDNRTSNIATLEEAVTFRIQGQTGIPEADNRKEAISRCHSSSK